MGTRRSLLRPTSHGFARFFAFETILVLIVVNARCWFEHPLAINQIASWLLLSGSLVSLIWGVVMLKRLGGPRQTTRDPALYSWEDTSRLVTTGIYRYIRHPMYASLLFLAWGAVLKAAALSTLLLGIAATVALLFTAKAEERENLAHFGTAYSRYMEHTRLFVPFLF